MKRAIAAGLLVLALGACSSDTKFNNEGGVCYRTRAHKFLGMQYKSSEVQALDTNCA